MNIKEYYNRYWSAEGFSPQGDMDSDLIKLFTLYTDASSRCVDVGCGDCLTSGPWLQAHAASYVGVDVAETAVATALERGFDARLVQDASFLPFADSSFDFVVCTEVLEHLFDPLAALVEIRRVLRTGGTVVVTVPNIAYWRRRLDLALFGRWNPGGDDLSVDEPWRDPHIRFFNRGSLGSLLRTAGLTPISVVGRRGAFLADLPVLRKAAFGRRGGSIYRRVERALPSLLGLRLYAVAVKP